jgi:hypothetical protein
MSASSSFPHAARRTALHQVRWRPGARAVSSGLGPLEAAAQAFTQAPAQIEGYSELARARRALIGSSPELKERDLAKMASMTTAVADALTRLGTPGGPRPSPSQRLCLRA